MLGDGGIAAVVVGASATEGAKVSEGEAVVAGITTRTPGGKHNSSPGYSTSRAVAPFRSSSVLAGIDARSAINNQESPARTSYVDPQVWGDGADVVSVLCAIALVSLFSIVATSAFTPSAGLAVEISNVELSDIDGDTTAGNSLALIRPDSFKSLFVRSTDCEVIVDAWLREKAKTDSVVRRVDHATGATSANAARISNSRLAKGSIRGSDQRVRRSSAVSL